MAHKNDKWLTVQQEYMLLDNPNLRELAIKHNVSYNTIRKKVGDWKKKKDMAQAAALLTKKKCTDTQSSSTMHNEPTDAPSIYIHDIPEHRDILHMEMYDKLAFVVLKYLDNPDYYFETENGQPKGKFINDIAQTIKNIQQGHNEAADRLREIEAANKETKLDKYTAAINMLREQQIKESKEAEDIHHKN